MAGALLLVRHGSTGHNNHPDGERLRGRLNISLGSTGIVGARHAGRFLHPYEPVRLFTSDLPRARQTAQIMSVSLGLTVEPRAELGPWDIGNYAGEPVSEAGPILTEYMTTRSTETVPGGESFRAFLQRWKTELLRLLALMRKLDEPIVAVTHARNLYSLKNLIFGEEIPFKGPPLPSAVLRLAGNVGEVTVATIFAGESDEGGFSG